jgi:hypothetical protein
MTVTCEYCNQEFTKKRALDLHQKTAKYCIELQRTKGLSVIDVDIFKCECGEEYTRKSSLKRHQKSCSLAKEGTIVKMVNNIDKSIVNHCDINIVGDHNSFINSNNTFNINNNITMPSTFTIHDLTDDWIVSKLTSVISQEIIKKGIEAITELIVQVVLNRNGQYCYWCTDKSRQKFRMMINHE